VSFCRIGLIDSPASVISASGRYVLVALFDLFTFDGKCLSAGVRINVPLRQAAGSGIGNAT
jgi:hypothetical protein